MPKRSEADLFSALKAAATERRRLHPDEIVLITGLVTILTGLGLIFQDAIVAGAKSVARLLFQPRRNR